MTSRSVRTRQFPYTVTTPAGTDPSLPTVTTLVVPDTVLDTVTLLIPAGHAYLTGWALLLAGQQLLPWPTDSPWIVGNDSAEVFTVSIEVDGALTVATYNLDLYDHTHWFRLKLDDIDLGAKPAPTVPFVVL